MAKKATKKAPPKKETKAKKVAPVKEAVREVPSKKEGKKSASRKTTSQKD